MSPGPFRHRATGSVTPLVARDPDDHYGKEFSGTPADQPCEMQHAHQEGMCWVHVRQRWFRWLPIEHTVARYETDACSCTVDCLGRAEAFVAIGGGSAGSGWPTFLCTPHVQWASVHRLLSGPDSGALLAVDAGGVWRGVAQDWSPGDRVGSSDRD